MNLTRAVGCVLLCTCWLIHLGCAPTESGRLRQLTQERRALFDGEQARTALIAMVERSDQEVLKFGLLHLKQDKRQILADSKVAIGQWRIDLEKKTFVLALVGESGLIEFDGTFERKDPAGPWQAQIERTRQT